MKYILFVDDEPRVLDGLRRMLHDQRDIWHMEFAGGGEQALVRLAEKPFDVVVSDMRMPGMDGAALLNAVKLRYPQTVRIILSGQSDHEVVLKSVGQTHQFLAKPCEAEELKATVARACALRDRMADAALKELTSAVYTLPSIPSVYCEIMEELRNADVSIRNIADIIARDVAMTAKILQMVNSAFFGLPRKISCPAQAVTLLGLQTVRALALSAGIFAQFQETTLPGYSLGGLANHSLDVAVRAREFAKSEGCEPQTVDEAFLAGVLHEIGQLVLVANMPERYALVLETARRETRRLWEVEIELLGASHADVGAYLMGLWGLPDVIVEAIAFHHAPSASLGTTFRPLTAVHVADVLHHQEQTGLGLVDAEFDEPYLQMLNLQGRIPLVTPVSREHSLEVAS